MERERREGKGRRSLGREGGKVLRGESVRGKRRRRPACGSKELMEVPEEQVEGVRGGLRTFVESCEGGDGMAEGRSCLFGGRMIRAGARGTPPEQEEQGKEEVQEEGLKA